MSDIVEVLRSRCRLKHYYPGDEHLVRSAADEILRLRAELKESRRLFARETDEYIKWMDEAQAENAKLRAALKPFADKADHHTQGAYWMDAIFTVDECRAAVAALKETGG